MKLFIRVIFLGWLVLVFSRLTFSQISSGGTPWSFSQKIDNPIFVAPSQQELKFIDTISKDCSAMEFGRFLPVNISLKSELWQTTKLPNGDYVYRLGVFSEGAKGVGAYFRDFHLPVGSTLFIYSPDHQQQIGAFNHLNNSAGSFFATSYLTNDSIIIEYFEPKEVSGQGTFVLADILHAYRGVGETIEEKGFGGSGNCEVNVNCSEGYGKGNQRDAVLRLLIRNGSSGVWCTGSLINNTSEDRTPYVLTADHCGKNSSEEDMLQWVFYFHYQSSGCDNPTIEPQLKSMSGCVEMASSSNAEILGSDFFLVKLIDEIPAEYNPYFIGWSREGSVSNSGYSIHHPQGDIKKISHYTTPLQSTEYDNGIVNGFWQVTWSATENGHGVTEGGSSGSPIFDSEGYLIGTLTGGQASCSALTAPDYYGKLSVHWVSNGLLANQQLMPWLDPLETGALKMNGIYLGVNEAELLRDDMFQIFPNPTSQGVNIIFKEMNETLQIQVIQVNGQVADEFRGSPGEPAYLDLSSYASGIYFIQVSSAKASQMKRLIKI